MVRPRPLDVYITPPWAAVVVLAGPRWSSLPSTSLPRLRCAGFTMKLSTLASSLAVLAPFFGAARAQVFDPDQGQGSVQWDPAKIGTNKVGSTVRARRGRPVSGVLMFATDDQ